MMSIIVRNEQTKELVLYSKGADSSIIPLLKSRHSRTVEETSKNLVEYAKIGLRTLVLAKRTLSLEEYNEWKKRYDV